MLRLLVLILFPSLHICKEVSGVCNRTEIDYVKVYHTGYHMIYYQKRFDTCTWGLFGDSCRTRYEKRTKSAPYTFHRYRMNFRKEFFCCPGYFGEQPNCKRLCDRLDHPSNGIVKFYNNSDKLKDRKDVPVMFPGYTAYYKCDYGYSMNGDELRTCQDDGKGWTGKEPSCLDPCPYLASPHHGHVHIENPLLGIIPHRGKGTTAHTWCNDGYTLDGDGNRECKVQGDSLQWSGKRATCKARSCGDPGVPNNGTRFGTGFTYTFEPVLFRCDNEFALIGSNSRRCERSGRFSGTQPVCKPILDQCEESGSIVLDECNRRCECDNNNELVKCTRVRKSWTDLSSDEKQRYIDAVKTLTTDEQYKERYEEHLTNYTKKIIKTNSLRNGKHSFRAIFNRFALLQYENMLREIDCRITIPYWDWTAYRETPYKHPVWDNTLGFGDSARLWDDCVSSGPFNFSVFQVPDITINTEPEQVDLNLNDFNIEELLRQYHDFETIPHGINTLPEQVNVDLGDTNIDEWLRQQNPDFERSSLPMKLQEQQNDESVDGNFDIPELPEDTKWYTIDLGDTFKHIHYLINEDARPEPEPHCLKREYKQPKPKHLYNRYYGQHDEFPSWKSVIGLLADNYYYHGIYYGHRELTEHFLLSLDEMAKGVLCQVGGHLCSDKEKAFDPIYSLHLSFIDLLYDIWTSFPQPPVYTFNGIDIDNSDNPLEAYGIGDVSITYNVPEIQN